MKSFYFRLMLLFVAVTAQAQNNNYVALDGPYGGPVRKIIQSGTRLVGIVDGQGIVVSDDGGSSWTTSNTGLTTFYLYDLERDPGTGTLYVISSNGLYSSSNDGNSWIVLATNGFSSASFLRRAPNGYLFIATTTGTIYRSTDGGTSWPASAISVLPGSPSVTDFEISSTGYLWIATNGSGVFRSNSPNSAIGFTQFGSTQGLASDAVYSIAVVGSTAYVSTFAGPFKATNNGSAWTSIKADIPDNTFNYPYPLIEYNNGSLFFFHGGSRTLRKSDNDGESWTAVSYPLDIYGAAYSEPRTLFVQDPSTLFVSYRVGTFKSIDGGVSWSPVNAGITGYAMERRDALVMTDNGRLLYAPSMQFGLFMSIDDGASWDFFHADPLDRSIIGFKRIGSTIYGYGSRLIKTNNNGDSWTEVSDGKLLGCNVPSIAVLSNSDESTLYTLALYNCTTTPETQGLFVVKSEDAGVTWPHAVSVTGMPPNGTYAGMYEHGFPIDEEGNGYLQVFNYEIGRYQLYRIDLETGEATNIASEYPLNTGFDYHNGKLYATALITGSGGGHRLLTSADAGETWNISVIPNSYARIRAMNNNTLYLLASNVYISTDGGNSWVDTGTFGTGRIPKAVIISPDNYSYIAVDFSTPYKSVAQVVPPSPPSNLILTGYSARAAGLTWNDNSDNEQYFVIERSTGNNTNYDSVGYSNASDAIALHIDLSIPDPNTLYYFRVRAVNAAGKSSPSNEISVTTPELCDESSIPRNRSWTAKTLDESGLGEFIETNVSISPSGGLHRASNLTLQMFNFTTNVFFVENCGSVFVYADEPIHANGNGTWDPETNTLTIHWKTSPNFETQVAETTVYTLNAVDPAPDPPSSVGAYIKTAGEIVVTWSSSLYAQEFQVQRSETSGSGFVDIGDPIPFGQPLLFIDEDDFVLGTTYYYRVLATAVGGASTPSAEVAVQFQTPMFSALSLEGYDFASQGVGWLDIENDGDEDLIIAPFNQPKGSINVFENMGDGTLQKIDVPGLTDFERYAGSVNTTLRTISVGDANNDGLVDFIANGPATGGHLWINQGNKQFSPVELVRFAPGSPYTYYAQLVDFNNDGRLDAIFSEDFANENPIRTKMRIFTQSEDGTFTPYELGEIAADEFLSFAGGWADIDNDLDQDFLRTSAFGGVNDFDRLYLNNSDGTFTRVDASGFESEHGMQPRSISWGDFDNDLDLDVFIATITGNHNMLFENDGAGNFTALTGSALAESKTGSSYASAWGDVDNDGDLDIVVGTTGRSALYLNDGNGNFTKHEGDEYIVAFDVLRTTAAYAFADYDNNGTLDLATGKSLANFPTIILRNNLVPDENHQWLKVRLKGTTSNASGIGARIEIETPNGKKQMRPILANTGNGSAGSLTAHFGLKDQSTVSTIRVYWPSGAMQVMRDQSSNQLIEIVEDGRGPVATTLQPQPGSAGANQLPELKITFDEPSTPVAGKTIKVVLASNPGTVVFSANATAGTKTGETYTFTLSQRLALSTDYRVIVEEGAFIDKWENPCPEISGDDWSFTTTPGPLADLTPAKDATLVAVNTNLTFSFNRTVTPVPGKKIKVFNGSTPLLDVDVTTGSVTGQTYSLDPSADFPDETLLTVVVDYGAFVDENGNEFAGIALGEWQFTTTDITLPQLTFNPAPLEILDKGFSPVQVTATATDNNEVAAVNFWHRKPTEKNFTLASMTRVGETNSWSISVPNTFAGDMGFEFYVEAVDQAGNKRRSPAAESEFHKCRIRFADNNAPVVSVPGEGTLQSWRIIAIPHELNSTSPQISDVFKDMGTASPTSWRMITYTNAPQEAWLEFPNGFATLQRGKGYFINAITGKNIALNNASSPPFGRSNLFELQLVQGWNQIGNPYTVSINWEDVRTFNDAADIVGSLKLYTNGSYVNGTELLPMQGGFVFAQEATTVSVSFPGQTPDGGRTSTNQVIGSDLASTQWIVPLTLEHETIVNALGGIGMHPEASPSFDRYDDANAPRFMKYMEMKFDHPEHFIKAFARDVVPTREAHTWTFAVESNLSGGAVLRWDNSGFGDNDSELFLVDESHQTITDMRMHSEYHFDVSEETSFRIYFGTDLVHKIIPPRVTLAPPYPNPSDGEVLIHYTIPDNMGDVHADLAIYDLLGRKVTTLFSGTLKPGYYNSRWRAQDSAVADGVFVCKLAVSSGKQQETRTRKITIRR